MLNNDAVEMEVITALSPTPLRPQAVEVPSSAPVRLQTLDLARHIAIAPQGMRYVVATYDNTRVNLGYVSAVYPQENGYLTLVRLKVCEFTFDTPEQALQRHLLLIQVIQQGKLKEFLKKNTGK